ncbi:YopX family protein [Paenibacillus alvei]|uniref:Protein YopX n=1 Tax=Paenibacillus alvei TaxID=44250 RepID=A0A383RCT1_PAEAL|nr:YopX family protein [Paenibacillus alvei]SYX84633.1 Protein YopX [Paenibacillus alvei]
MRQIKFRAWDVFSEKMDYEVFLDPNGKVAAFSPLWGFYVRGNSDDEMKLMQFTGLRDRNGQEIYEGDVLVDEYGFIHVVQYFQPDCRYITVVIEAFKSGNWDDSNEHEDLVWVECKVIGNIYEHPYLLKGDSKDA